MSWDAIREIVCRRFVVAADEGELLRLWWSFARDDGPMRELQEVRVGAVVALGEGAVRVTAPVGPPTLVDPAWALELNAELAVGAVALCGGEVVVTAVLLDVEEEALARALHAVAHEAARLRRGGAADRAAPVIFSEYAA